MQTTIHNGSKDLGSQTLNFPPNKQEGMLGACHHHVESATGFGTKAGCLNHDVPVTLEDVKQQQGSGRGRESTSAACGRFPWVCS